MMTGKERELDDFKRIFSFLKDEPVVLYGTGQYTDLLLRELHDFHFIGLMDQNKTGRTCYGLRVLNIQEAAASGCKAVIIVANLSIAPTIYQRIRKLEKDRGIAVYYMNGRRPAKTYWDVVEPVQLLSEQQLFAMAMECDVVSFDLFDTLMMRKCLLPDEIFSIAAAKALKTGIGTIDFAQFRRQAENVLYRSGRKFYGLAEIYKLLAERYGDRGADRLMQIELGTELEMARPRPDMVRLYQVLLDMGKRVVITSDMYLSAEQLKPLLRKCGIENAELYVSNERKASKHLGTLFRQLKADFPEERILHIGDNPRCDVENAKQEGIHALYVASAASQMEFFGLDKLQNAVQNDAKRHMYELFAQRCFAPAFRRGTPGKILISDQAELGYLFFGPLAVGYLAWLAGQLRREKIGHVLFVSRDGYLFDKLYQKLRGRYGDLPPASYFLTSRRCAAGASLKTEADVRFVFEDVCYSKAMDIGGMLEKAYGVAANKEDPLASRTLGELGSHKAWNHLREHYLDRILERAAVERTRYLQYIKTFGLTDEKLGMMNFVGRGVTQRCLQNVLERELTGFYFALEYDAAYILDQEYSARSWYPKPISPHVGQSRLAEQLLLGETVFSAPHGAVVAFSDDETPIYEPTKPERAVLVAACHHGIEAYMEDILQMEPDLEGLENTVDLADAIFGLLCDGRFLLSEEIKAGLTFEDRFQ